MLKNVKRGNFNQVQGLLQAGVNPNIIDENGASALMWAAYRSNLEMVRLLVDYGADPNRKGIIVTDKDRGEFYASLLSVAIGEDNITLLQ
ncbi:MAG: ankyrin repeat domain-containing protein, partial [Candidatus Hodarchaeota archaeon]